MILFTIIFSICILTITAEKLHEHMTKEEIEAVFNVKHDEVHKLEYDVAPIYHMDNGQTNVKLRAFNRNYDLYLEKNDHILLGEKTPVYIANGVRGNFWNGDSITYSRIPYPFPNYLGLYQDRHKRAALAVHKDIHNNAHLDGIIGDDVIIRHVPPRIHNEVFKNFPHLAKKTSSDYKFASSNSGYEPVNHVIIKPQMKTNDFKNVAKFEYNWRTTTRAAPNWQKQNHAPSLNQYPTNRPQIFNNNDIIYPELLITVDYNTFKIHGSNVQNVAKYMAAFWNAVDLRFRELNNPKVRLNIAGLIIPQETKGAPYFEAHIANVTTLFCTDTLYSIGQYFMNSPKFPRNTFDIVVGITQRNLGEITNGILQNSFGGMAYLGGACDLNGQSAAIISDRGGFGSINSAAHELGHSMGAPHDGDESKVVPGGPCLVKEHDGYLMSYERGTLKGVHWSQCSITAMRNFFKSESGQCLKNKPNPGKPYPKILPGRLMTRDEQCQRTFKTKADESNKNNCVLLFCGGTTLGAPPAEGSSCGHEMICLDAVCVRDPELRN